MGKTEISAIGFGWGLCTSYVVRVRKQILMGGYIISDKTGMGYEESKSLWIQNILHLLIIESKNINGYGNFIC